MNAAQEVDRLHAVAAAISGHKAAIAELTPERDKLVRALRERGLSLREIASLAGVSHVAVRQILNRR
jgi:DNA-directed RNA polymerase specialized sigma24 family protein